MDWCPICKAPHPRKPGQPRRQRRKDLQLARRLVFAETNPTTRMVRCVDPRTGVAAWLPGTYVYRRDTLLGRTFRESARGEWDFPEGNSP